jgi:hypothetical protein
MNEMKRKIIRTAMKRHAPIFPVARRQSLYDCFTVVGTHVVFWYNTEDQSTHTIRQQSPRLAKMLTENAGR